MDQTNQIKFYTTNNGIMVVQTYLNRLLLTPITIKIIKMPIIPDLKPYQVYINNKYKIERDLNKNDNKETKLVLFREYNSYIHPDSQFDRIQYTTNIIVNQMQRLKRRGMDIHILKTPYDKKNCYILIAVVLYQKTERISFSNSSPQNYTKADLDNLMQERTNTKETTESLVLNGYDNLYLIPEMIRLENVGSKLRLSFATNLLSKHPQVAVCRSDLVKNIIHEFNDNSLLNNRSYSLKEYSYTDILKKINTFDHLAIYSPHNLFLEFLQDISNFSKNIILKVGGKCPPGFETISFCDIRSNFVELLNSPISSDYIDILNLISSVYNIKDFTESMLRFWEDFNASLDTETLNKTKIDDIQYMIKNSAASEFDFPIENNNKINILMFFELFPISILRKGNPKYPNLIHIPTTNKQDDIISLALTLRHLDLYDHPISILILDDPLLVEYLHSKDIYPIFSSLLRESGVIYRINYPGKNYLQRYEKLIIKPKNTIIHYMKKYDSDRDFIETSSYLITTDNRIFPIDYDFNPTLYKSLISNKNSTRNDKDYKFTKSTMKKSSINLKEGKQKLNLKQDKKNQDTHLDKMLNFVDNELKSKDLEKDNLPDEVKTENRSGSNKHIDRSTDVKSGSSDEKELNSKVHKTDNWTESKQDSIIRLNEIETLSESQNGTLKGLVNQFNDTFDIKTFIASEKQFTTDSIVSILDESTLIFSILNRLYHATRSFVSEDEFNDDEKLIIEETVEKELVISEKAKITKYRLLDKGRTKIVDLIKDVKSIKGTPHYDDLTEKITDILEFQKDYGKQSYAFSLMVWGLFVGEKYYQKFRIIPPEILGIQNFVNIIRENYGGFQFEDPSQFTSIFESKYAVLFQQYLNELEEESSKIRDDMIDNSEKPVPKPKITEDISEPEEIRFEMDKDTTISTTNTSRTIKIIADDNASEDLSRYIDTKVDLSPRIEVVEKDNDGQIKTENERKDILPLKALDVLDKTSISTIIEDQKINYKNALKSSKNSVKLTSSNNQKNNQFVLYEFETSPVTFDQLMKFPVEYLSLPTRIVKICKKFRIEDIGTFAQSKFSRDINGIGPKSMEIIERIQKLISSYELINPEDIIYFFSDFGITELVGIGHPLPLKHLPENIYFQDKEFLTGIYNVIDEESDPIKIVLEISNSLLQNLDSEYDYCSDINDVLSGLMKFQDDNFDLCIDVEDKKSYPLSFPSVFKLKSRMNNGKLSTKEMKENLKAIVSSIYFNSSVFNQ